MSPNILLFCKTYLTCFFLLGQSSVDPRVNFIAKSPKDSFGPYERFFLRAREVLPSMCFGTLAFILGHFSFHNFSLNSLASAVYCVFITSAFTTCLLVLVRTPILGHRSQCLWTKFMQYERFVLHRLRIKITYYRFRKIYNRKVYISLLTFLLVLTATVVYKLGDHKCNSVKRYVSALILIFLTVLIDLQILFYISLLGYLLENVNHHIVDLFCVVDCGDRNRIITAAFKDYKVVYYKLWEISQLINDNFGWILVSLLMKKANGTVQSFYWVIVELHEKDVLFYPPILSKYYMGNVFYSVAVF